jgi:hypothetical protein
MNTSTTYVLKVWTQPHGGFQALLRAVDEELTTRFDDPGALVRHLRDTAAAAGGGTPVPAPVSSPHSIPATSTPRSARSPR